MVENLLLLIEEVKVEKNYLLNILSKLITIKKSVIFKEAYKRGVTIKSGCFTLRFLPVKQNDKAFMDSLQFGFVISKKIGIAVKRNFIRRQLKHAIRECLLSFNNIGYYIFIVQSEVNDSKYAEILYKIKKSLELLDCLLKNDEKSC